MEKIVFLKWVVAGFYALSIFFYVRFFISQNTQDKRKLPYVMFTTILVHAIYLISLGISIRHFPLGNVFQVMTSYVFIFITIYFIIEQKIKEPSLGTIILFIALILQVISNIFIDLNKQLAQILAHLPLFGYHVMIMLLAYSSFTISFIASIMYIMLSREIHKKQLGFFFSRLPSLELLDRLSNLAVAIGTTFITIGIILGTYMASQVWGTKWLLDPKLISVFITWLIYAAFIYFRNVRGWQGKRASIISISGFIWVMISFTFFTTVLSKVHAFI